MKEVHVELRCGPAGCEVADRTDGEPGVTVNEQPIKEGPITNGDELRVASTRFAVIVHGPGPSAPDGGSMQATVRERLGTLELTPTALELLGDQELADYLAQLVDGALYEDAVRVLAYTLPRPAAVHWSVECARSTGTVPDGDPALLAADSWAREPNEEHRRAAESAAAESAGPQRWIALAAFWSGRSIAPADFGEVPPDDRLTSTAITSALRLVSNASDEDPSACLRRFVEWGRSRGPTDAAD